MKCLFLAGGLAAGLLFGQEPQPRSSPSPTEPRATSSEGASNPGKTSTDKAAGKIAKFVQKAAQSNAKEIRVAEMASEKAENADVRAFAQKLVTDHTAATDELKTLAESKGVTLSTADPEQHEKQGKADKAKDKLAAAQGAAFDRAFLEQQTKHHEKDVAEFQKAASSHPDNDVRAFASKQLPVLREHLDMARSLQKDVVAKAKQGS